MRSHAQDSEIDPPKAPDVQLAAAVRTRRAALRLRQAQLGELAGCVRLFVHRLETAKSSLRLDKAQDLLLVLGFQLEVRTRMAGLVDCSHETH